MGHRKSVQPFIRLTLILLFLGGCSAPADKPEATSIPTTLPLAPTPIATTISTIIFDDDGSRDGLVALLYLLSYPEISIQAISVSYGEAHPKLYVQHIGRILDQLGISGTPLGAGQDAPLGEGTPFPDWLRNLSDKFWDYPVPNAGKTYPFQDAPQLMVSVINQSSEPMTIFLSGPFTNLAQALRLDPGIRNNISAVYFMGGAVKVPGNITNLVPESANKVAEWNILADPQAAKEVFSSGLDLYMVPLDATNKVIIRQKDIAPWRQGSEKAKMAADLYDIMFNSYGFDSAEIFDLTAAVLTVRSELCTFEPLHLEVITDAGDTLGQTITVPNTEANIHACLKPDAASIRRALNEAFE